MGQIEWAMWANEQAIVGALVNLLGGILGVIGMFTRWEIGAYAIPASILILLLEYPRGKRKKGHTIERSYQKYLTRPWSHLGLFTKNYYIRFVIILLLCVPCFFVIPTLLGAVSLFIASIIYFVAAVKGEEWIPVPMKEDASKTHQIERNPTFARPPSRKAPRQPVPAGFSNAAVDDVRLEDNHV